MSELSPDKNCGSIKAEFDAWWATQGITSDSLRFSAWNGWLESRRRCLAAFTPSHALPISRAGCSPVPDLEAEEKLLGTPRSTTPRKAPLMFEENAALEHLSERIALRVAEIPDRTSPEDQPEMMLVTPQELKGIVEDELSTWIEQRFAASATACSAARYEWLRAHMRWSEDTLSELWFDACIELDPEIAAELDKAIDSAMRRADGGKQTDG